MKKKKMGLKVFLTLLAGLVCGFFGGGGGMLAVPLLIYGFDYKQKEAHSTAIVLMLMCSVAAAVNYASFLKTNMNTFWFVLIGGVLGSFIGAVLLKKLNSKLIKKAFGVLVVVAGVIMIIRGVK